MKIMMLSGDKSLAAGKRGAFYYMLEELSKYCERIDVICPQETRNNLPALPAGRQGGKAGRQDTKKFQTFFDNVFVHPGRKSKLSQIFYLAKKGKELWDEYKHDIVLIHEYPPFYNSLGARLLRKRIDANSGEIGLLSSPSHGVKFVVEIHHIIGYPKTAGWKEKFYFWLSKIMIPRDCKRFDAVRIVNKKQVPELLKGLGVDGNKLRYASSMYIDLDVFKPMNVDKKYDLVFAGRLMKNKNVGMLIEAVGIVRCKMPEVRCAIIGDGLEMDNLKSKVKSQNLNENIEFLGWLPRIEDVAKVYNQSRIFVMPSLNEGGPRVCLEAMACGVPVVTTRVGVMLDIIDDGVNGVFCGWDAEDLADKIIKIREYENMKIGEAARKTVMRFERREMIRVLAETYQGIACVDATKSQITTNF